MALVTGWSFTPIGKFSAKSSWNCAFRDKSMKVRRQFEQILKKRPHSFSMPSNDVSQSCTSDINYILMVEF
jgi:hypothetical protein